MWVYRRILRISWVDRITNEEVLRRVKKKREILLLIKERKLQYLGHIMRNRKYQLLQLMLQGRIEGRRSVGRQRSTWLSNLREWLNLSTVEIFRGVTNKKVFASMISNLRNGVEP